MVSSGEVLTNSSFTTTVGEELKFQQAHSSFHIELNCFKDFHLSGSWPFPLWTSINIQTWKLESDRLSLNSCSSTKLPWAKHSTSASSSWKRKLECLSHRIVERVSCCMIRSSKVPEVCFRNGWSFFFFQFRSSSQRINHLEVYNPVTFSTSTMLCNHLLFLVLKHFHGGQRRSGVVTHL